MSLLRPVSEVYGPADGNSLINIVPNEHYKAWNYEVAYEVDKYGEDVPDWGNTAIFRIFPGGMTEPVYVTKPDYTARFTLNVLGGSGLLIRALASGAVEEVSLKEGDECVIEPGQAYSYVNTGDSDLLLHDVAMPAFRDGDEGKLAEARTFSQNDKMRKIPGRFYDAIGQAAAGRLAT